MLSPQLQLFVAADEWNEAAFGGEAVVKSKNRGVPVKLGTLVLRSLRRSGAPNRTQPRSTRQLLRISSSPAPEQ